jgi:hypothetical protein
VSRRSQEAALRARLLYLAKFGKTLLPRAFLLNSQGVLFTDYGPYEGQKCGRILAYSGPPRFSWRALRAEDTPGNR